MGFYILRSMSATLVAFLMVMCATPAGCSDPDPYGLVFNRNPLSWADAEAYCVSLGGHLASVSSEAMARHIDANYVRGGACHATWIGYNDRATEGDWVWTGAASSYTNWWQPTEPNDMGSGEDCALLGIDCIYWTHFLVGNRWTDYGCSNAQASVCQVPPTPPSPPSQPSPPFSPPSPSSSLPGHYFSFETGGNPNDVFDRFEARVAGNRVTYYRGGKPRESFEIRGNQLHEVQVQATVQPNGDIVHMATQYRDGYTSRKEFGCDGGESGGLNLGSTPSHGNPPSTSALNTELNNVARNTDDTAKARALVAAGAQLDSTNGPYWNHTPLHQAAIHGRYRMAACLVKLGAPLQLPANPSAQPGTPLELALLGGHTWIAEMIEQAIQEGSPDPGSPSTPTAQPDATCEPNPFKCDSSIGGDCCMARATSHEDRRCRDGWIPIYTGVLPLLRLCYSCIHTGKGSCLRRAALTTELLPRPYTVPHRKWMCRRRGQHVHLLPADM